MMDRFQTLLPNIKLRRYTKETNARTRQQAFKLMVDIPRAMERRAGRSGAGSQLAGGAGGGMLGVGPDNGT
jgi:hypothetical protein